MDQSAIPAPDIPSAEESEQWLPVVGWECLYMVSDLGRVRSLPRLTPRGIRGGQLLKPGLSGRQPDDRFNVILSRSGMRQNKKIHKLVAEAFIGPCLPGQEVRHGPGGRYDNRLVNLCYGTPKENAQDKVRDGTTNRGERHGHAKLTAGIVAECRRRAGVGENQTALAAEFGVDPGTMWNALSGRTWFEVPVAPVPRGVRGPNNGLAKITREQVEEIRRRHANGEIQRVIAADYGIKRQAVSKIVLGQRWAS